MPPLNQRTRLSGRFLGKEVGTNDHGVDLLPRHELDILERDLDACWSLFSDAKHEEQSNTIVNG
jgi:hypothetical protein